jgi:CheY-like chemotaxis protein
VSASKNILFVDDDSAYLSLFGELMRQASAGAWNVILAENPARGLSLLKEHRFDMLVVDERMPVMSGLQFVRLARTQLPSVPIVVLTGHAEEQAWQSLIREGIEALLQKPTCSEGFQTLFLTLSQLLALERQHGFRGVMHDVQLQDILQLECLRRNSSVLVVSSKSESGEIFIRTGSIVHAAVGVLTGESAFYHLLNLQDGEFRLKAYEDPPVETIAANWETLLMEAAQLRDEVAGREMPAVLEEPAQPQVSPSAFPPVKLTAAECEMPLPSKSLLAVSIEGCVLATLGHHDFKLPSQLSDVLSRSEWFKTAAALGSLESFEASTPSSHLVMHFQPESLVFVRQERRAAHE